MLQTVKREDGVSIRTTSSPIRVDGMRRHMTVAAPRIGEHNARLRQEFALDG
jgi:crotonobetainyl-CoA:carnitine CoA-transferase CaiB-like acyl-CoA transferase